jgi:hypothetical protein
MNLKVPGADDPNSPVPVFLSLFQTSLPIDLECCRGIAACPTRGHKEGAVGLGESHDSNRRRYSRVRVLCGVHSVTAHLTSNRDRAGRWKLCP